MKLEEYARKRGYIILNKTCYTMGSDEWEQV